MATSEKVTSLGLSAEVFLAFWAQRARGRKKESRRIRRLFITEIIDERVCDGVNFVGGLVFAEGDMPLRFVPHGEEGIGRRGRGVDMGETQLVGQRHGGGIELRTADDEDFGIACECNCLFERCGDFGVGPRLTDGARNDDVSAIGECALGQRLVGVASHDDGMARGERFEAAQVVAERIEQLVVQPDGIVFGQSTNDGDHD